MKRIIKPKPYPLFVTYCPKCTCTFEYEEEDLQLEEEAEVVSCPKCGDYIYHSTTHIKQ